MTIQNTGSTNRSKTTIDRLSHVVVCRDSLNTLQGIDVEALAEGLQELTGSTVKASVAGGLCGNPRTVREQITGDGKFPLTIGVCRGEYSRSELIQHAKKAGAHPLSTQLVELKGRELSNAEDAEDRVHGALVALAAAVVRAAAAPIPTGSNMKPILLSGDGRVSRRSLFTLPPVEYVGIPTIDRPKCAATDGCRVCVGNCPHDAITASEAFISIDRKACLSCGICVSVCPQRAIELPGNSVDELEAQVEIVSNSPAGAPIVFSCAKAESPPGDGWQVVPVACAGMVPVAAMVAALNGGASTVAVRQCTSVCTQNAGKAVAGRVDFVSSLLETIGDSPSRAALLTPADQNMAEPVPKQTSNNSSRPSLERRFFGVDAAWLQLTDFTERRDQVSDQRLEHGSSPTGQVTFEQTACTTCGTCALACPTGAISEEGADWTVKMAFNPTRCVACGECVANCPEVEAGAITMTKVFSIGPSSTELSHSGEGASISCKECGKVFTTSGVLERLKQILGDDFSEKHMGELCSDCRGLPV
jgi:ferredoxin